MKNQKKFNLDFFFPLLKFKIRENSMVPTILSNTTVLVNKLAFLFKKPKIGDMVIIKNPKQNEKFLLKRIQIIKNGKYFVVGDNLKESIDSRSLGAVEKKDIIGKVIMAIK